MVPKVKPELKIDILNWIGREAKKSAKHDIIQNLEIRFDLPAKQILLEQLGDANFDVKQAAAWTLVKIGDKSYIPSLAELLKSDDKQVVLLGQDALAAFPGDIDGQWRSCLFCCQCGKNSRIGIVGHAQGYCQYQYRT